MDQTLGPTSIVCHLPQLALPWIQSSLWDTWRSIKVKADFDIFGEVSFQVATYCFIMLPPSIFCFSWLKYDVLWWIDPLDPPQLFAICHNYHWNGLPSSGYLLLNYASALNFLLWLTQIWCPVMDRTLRPTSIVCHLPQLLLPWTYLGRSPFKWQPTALLCFRPQFFALVDSNMMSCDGSNPWTHLNCLPFATIVIAMDSKQFMRYLEINPFKGLPTALFGFRPPFFCLVDSNMMSCNGSNP